MPPRFTDAEERLIAGYTEAAQRLERLLHNAKPQQRRILMARVDAVLRSLEDLTRGYIREDLPAHFIRGSEDAVKRLKKIRGFGEIDEAFSQVHKAAIQQIADDASQSFGRAVVELRKSAEKTISQARKQEIMAELLASEVSGGKADVKKVFEEANVFGIRIGNRTWGIEHYSSMLTSTLLAEAHNTGSATRYGANGVEYVRIIERADAPDKTCQWMKDKIVWIGERRLLNPYHPHCFGSFVPHFGDTSQALRSIEDPRIPEVVRKVLRK